MLVLKSFPGISHEVFMNSRPSIIVLIVVACFLAAGGFAAYFDWSRRQGLPEGLLLANGRIEGDRVTVAGKFAGRIQTLLVHEGDWVDAGQPLVTLDDTQIGARVDQAREGLAAYEARIQATATALGVLRQEVPLSIEMAEADLARATGALQKAQAAEAQAERDARRFRELVSKGVVEARRSEEADLAWEAARSDLISAEASLIQARQKAADAQLGWERIAAKEDELKALQAQRDQARAVLAEAESVLADLTITAPSDGMITHRIVNLGEVVQAGSPLYELVDLDSLYLKVYVPEIQIGKLRLDLPARIYTDAFPEQPFPARVRYIASNAEFTPKEVQTPDERVKLVFAVKLYLDENPEHRLAPGMPADAVIQWDPETPWTEPQW